MSDIAEFAEDVKQKIAGRRELILLCVFFVFEYLRPQENQLSFLSPLKLPFLTNILLVTVFLIYRKDEFSDKSIKLALFFALQTMFSFTFVVNHTDAMNAIQDIMWAFWGAMLPILVILHSREQFVSFFKFWMYLQFGLALFVINNGGGGPGSFIGDENDVALVCCMTIGMAALLAFDQSFDRRSRIVALLAFLALMWAVVASSSRGGFLGLVAALMGLWYVSDKKGQWLFYGVLILLVFGTVALSVLPAEYVKDMGTISDPNDSTRVERLHSWWIGWYMAVDNPLLGVGAGNYAWNVRAYEHLSPYYEWGGRSLGGRVSHSLWFTLIPEMGGLGVFLYTYLIWSYYRTYLRIQAYCKSAAFLARFPQAKTLNKGLLVGLGSYVIAGTFISVLWYPIFWYFVAFMAALGRLCDKEFAACQMEQGEDDSPLPSYGRAN